MEVPHSTSLDITDAITISAWVKPVSNPTYVDDTRFATVVSKRINVWTAPYWGILYHLFQYRCGAVKTYVFEIAGVGNAVGTSSYVLNQWAHIVGTYDGSKISIYKNGILENSVPATGLISTSTLPLSIGVRWPAKYQVNGLIDDVRIYNYARTADQVRSDYNAGYGIHFK